MAKILVCVSGGVVVAVLADDPSIECRILDWDNRPGNPDWEGETKDLVDPNNPDEPNRSVYPYHIN